MINILKIVIKKQSKQNLINESNSYALVFYIFIKINHNIIFDSKISNIFIYRIISYYI
jgi:hypothetical protein